jgi:hypothetical protein
MATAALARSRPLLRLKVQYGVTVFCGAFLLFQVQLVLGKYILPWFGGTSAVWTTCMLFFQVLLLGGYLYSHFICARLGRKAQASVHLAVLGASLLVISAGAMLWKTPLLPGVAWKPVSQEHPVAQILVLLAVAVGVQFLVLSTTGPLLQSWFSMELEGRSPYRLYALSNVGSLLGLVTYPFVVEPNLRLHSQAWVWCAGYLVFVAGSAACAFGIRRHQGPSISPPVEKETELPSRGTQLLWFLLPMVASVMLLGTTNLMCQEIAVVPFLWVVPLVVYLLTFIICFDNQKWYRRWIFHVLFALSLPVAVFVLLTVYTTPILEQICLLSVVLFASCMVCHGELVRLKPAPAFLTQFYVLLSAGGAAGALFVAIVAPWIFHGYTEFQVGLVACAVLLLLVLARDRQSWWYGPKTAVLGSLILLGLMLVPHFFVRLVRLPNLVNAMDRFRYYPLLTIVALLSLLVFLRARRSNIERHPRINLAQLASAVVLIALCAALYLQSRDPEEVRKDRNFYGVLTVEHGFGQGLDYYTLWHGRTMHGAQFPKYPKTPTAYFGPTSGIGLFLNAQPVCPPQCSRVFGIVGVGVGTLAAYGRPGDTIRFYEINPQVLAYSQGDSPYFTFLRDSAAKTEVVLGDGRLSLERELKVEGPRKFDLLVLDAFNGDAPPVHLLTDEAFQLYLNHLRGPDSVLAFHISNRSLDLAPVLLGHAMRHKMYIIRLYRPEGTQIGDKSDWLLLSRSFKVLANPAFAEHVATMPPAKAALLWTDDYSNLFKVLRKSGY